MYLITYADNKGSDYAQSNADLRFLVIESLDTVEYINEKKSDCILILTYDRTVF